MRCNHSPGALSNRTNGALRFLPEYLSNSKLDPRDKGQHRKMGSKALKKALRVPKDEREQRIHAGENQDRKEHNDQHEAGSTARM